MAELTEVKVPDIGDFSDVPVIEILVSVGDSVSAEDPLVTLESDKATMDVPAPADGTVREIKVAVGDSVSEGSLILMLDTGGGAAAGGDGAAAPVPAPAAAPAPAPAPEPAPSPSPAPAPASASGGGVQEVKVPDIGDFSDVPVIEIMVSVGDSVSAEDPLLTLESDKATMDVPAPADGTVKELKVSVGDTVSEGSVILLLETAGGAPAPAPAPAAAPAPAPAPSPAPSPSPARSEAPDADERPLSEEMARKYGASAPDPRAPALRPSPTAAIQELPSKTAFHATPAVRRFARELGVDLSNVRGTGRKGRILNEDVKGYVKQALSAPAAAAAPAGAPQGGMGIPPIPAVDFSKFGEVEERKLSRIKKISGPFLHRSWLNVPHVTHHDEADVTEMEDFRQSLKGEAEKKGVRVTALAFAMKALAKSLAAFPSFNASLSPDGESLILKKYFHIGIAVDTPNGLVVPVFRDVDQKGIFDLAAEMADISARARDGKLKPDEMQGGCMTISSLGGIGGTAFTPIVNAPEVAILGITRARMQPVWDGKAFQPRLMMPLDVSYDHRVIDGAEAARFTAHLAGTLSDLRRLLL